MSKLCIDTDILELGRVSVEHVVGYIMQIHHQQHSTSITALAFPKIRACFSSALCEHAHLAHISREMLGNHTYVYTPVSIP